MGRVQYAAKNIAFGYIGNFITMLLGFVVKKVFVMQLGDTLLGVNGLYTDVLTMLSLAELGIGTALNYSLYGPVARQEKEKIKAYMLFYKKAYRMIAMVVAGIGVILIPFLPVMVKNPGYITNGELRLYYVIFLFNTVSTYFVAYKYSLPNAEQKNYIQTNVITLTKLVSVTLQIVFLWLVPDFLLYLLISAGVELVQKIFVSRYLDGKYPYLKEKVIEPLSREETRDIASKTKALVFHKVGDMARLQTDSIIISSFLGVAWVGLIGFYTQVITSVSGFVTIIFNSVLTSFGNLIATEGKEKQFLLFRVYRFFAVYIYGFSGVGFYLLLSPLIELWIDKDHVISSVVVSLIVLDYFFKGERVVLSNFKTAAGVFEQDKYLTLIQGLVNLVISVALVTRIGIAGVYIGTVISGLIANISKPIIIYRVCFEQKAWGYFGESVKYMIMAAIVLGITIPLRTILMPSVTIVSFLAAGVMITVVFHVVFVLFYGRTEEFQYLFRLVTGRLGRKGK